MKVRKAIIPAAGRGTRLYPITKTQPKEMLPIYDKPIIQLVVEEAVASGIEQILIITGKNKESMERHFDLAVNGHPKLNELNNLLKRVDITFKRQVEPKGLGDAILQGKNFVGEEPVAILLGDDFYLDTDSPAIKQVMNIYESGSVSGVIGVEKLSPEKMISKGMVVVKNNAISKLVEKPEFENVNSDLAISGRYVVDSKLFSELELLSPSDRGEIELTDALQRLLEQGNLMKHCEIKGTRVDVGTPDEYILANMKYVSSDPNLKENLFSRFD
jgi:UTP--glucose-1-phosphate uridylyltransferase